jgi:HSP20 family protein
MAQPQNDRTQANPTGQGNETQDRLQVKVNPTPESQGTQGQGMQRQGQGQMQPMRGQQELASRRSPYGYSSPFSTMQRFMEQMDQVFGDFFGAGLMTPSLPGLGRSGLALGAWVPQIEVFREGEQLVVRADLPGMKEQDVRVDIQGDILTIAGERRQEQEDQREGWYHSERSYGSFQRSVQLPQGVNSESADATFENGVLEVRLSAPQASARNVEIRSKSPTGTPGPAKPSGSSSDKGGSDVH